MVLEPQLLLGIPSFHVPPPSLSAPGTAPASRTQCCQNWSTTQHAASTWDTLDFLFKIINLLSYWLYWTLTMFLILDATNSVKN